MEDYLQEMEELGDAPQQLAAHLRGLRRKYDMGSILDILGEMQ